MESLDNSSANSTDTSASKRERALGKILCEAASEGDLEHIKQLVESNASVDTCDYDKRYAMHLAAAEGHVEVVRYLISQKGNVNVKDRWGGYPLKDAAVGGHTAVRDLLLQHGAKIDEADQQALGQQLMCNAAAKGDLAQIKNLVAKGASVNACDYDRRSALHLAAAEGHDKVVEFLIQCGANVMCVDRWGASPLKDAVRGGHTRVQQLLFDAGACMENKIEAVKAQVRRRWRRCLY
ncbi:hypothetical protein GUITHDRAFT_73307 [Guillardia theta CCMP2712]|uniref:Uncharacterized protein n=1 Tax=Guillardia theta (strain CCMP2712) TaxID=905079 RepID=L1J3N9_GUITC|nr:hypothetical protein GUITHDRAFT_73307 [Guillardia theta CCMP2712]EKX43131.1 hypothetical protein GUITHDRAFT_73307 [Guillardia theta CCMP2712]|eukprot:XP_005830111.1 hypothetical protein GUITHDRAFT_73307 [Guillardia theta CCMP2712]